MPSDLIVPVAVVKRVHNHPNADRLDICEVLGYQCCVARDELKSGDKKIYIPIDSVLPEKLSDELGVTAHLSRGRVRQVRLRGEPSFGIIMDIPKGCDWEEGFNAAEYLKIAKYEPPVHTANNANKTGNPHRHDPKIDPHLHRYTHIQNGRLHSNVFEDGERVIVTEKIHGTSSRICMVDNIPIACSMGKAAGFNGRRQLPQVINNNNFIYRWWNKRFKDNPNHLRTFSKDMKFDNPLMKAETYWFPWTIPGVVDMMYNENHDSTVVTLYGEIYGGSVQSLDYGIPKGNGFGYAAFDIAINGKYVDAAKFYTVCNTYGIPVVPTICTCPYSLEKMKELSDGKSIVKGAEKQKYREGCVVKPISERTHPKLGRTVLKFIGTEYSLSKHKDKDTTDV